MSSETETREIVLKKDEGAQEPTEYYVVRRRKGRHRRRPALEPESPQQKFRMILLIFVVLLIVAYLMGGERIRAWATSLFHNAKGAVPSSIMEKYLRPELLLLLLAAGILLYLMVPGLGSTVSRWLGFGSSRERR